jgi:hypothetical protein
LNLISIESSSEKIIGVFDLTYGKEFGEELVKSIELLEKDSPSGLLIVQESGLLKFPLKFSSKYALT